jgi:hypothetical protein
MKVFVSYSETDIGKGYVSRFCTLLEDELRRTSGKSTVDLFFDGILKPGDVWPKTLEEKLNKADIFVPLFSTSFFQSEYCGREILLFKNRLQVGSSHCPIYPVLWSPLSSKNAQNESIIPKADDPILDNLQHHPNSQFSAGQFSMQSAKQMGLFYFLKNEANSIFSPILNEYLRVYVEKIVSDSASSIELEEVTTSLDELVSPYIKPEPPGPDGYPPPFTDASPRINIVVIAAKPDEVTANDNITPDAYRENGGEDWQPFWPDKKHLGRHFQTYVGNNNSNAYTQLKSFTNVKAILKMAEIESQGRRPFFIVIDPVTAQMPSYRDQIKELSQTVLPFCAILSPGTACAKDPSLLANLNNLLTNREAIDDPIFKTYFADTPADLESVVNRTYELIASKFRKRNAATGQALSTPFASGTRPTLSATTS